MSEIIELRLASGETVPFEVSETSKSVDPDEVVRTGTRGRVMEAFEGTIEEALDRVKPAAEAVLNAFKELNQPDEIGLEMGLQLKSGTRAFVISGEANATFKLSLKWTRKTEA